jgi:hypothetical protein
MNFATGELYEDGKAGAKNDRAGRKKLNVNIIGAVAL